MAAYWRIAAIGSSVALGAIATLVSHQYHRDIVRARTRIATGSRVISTSCGLIEYAEIGAGSPILGIHGAGGGFDQGLDFAAPIAARGYRVIAMSRFGYLRTPAPLQPSAALQADAHACLLDALGVSRAAVIAVSAGAASALEFALKYPKRCAALILLVPGWYPHAGSAANRMGRLQAAVVNWLLRSDFAVWTVSKFLPSFAQRTVLGTPPSVVAAGSPGEQARVSAVLSNILPISSRQIGLSLEGQLTTAALSQPLESISVPTLAISTQDDLYRTYDNAQFIAHHIPHCQFGGYHTGGHLWVGHNDEVISAVISFLQDHR